MVDYLLRHYSGSLPFQKSFYGWICPAFVNVDTVDEVVSDERTGCLACVDSCPSRTALTMRVFSAKWKVASIRWALMLAAARLFGPCDNAITDTDNICHLPAI